MYEMAVKIFSLYLYVIMVNCAITAHVEIIQNTGKVMLFFCLLSLSLSRAPSTRQKFLRERRPDHCKVGASQPSTGVGLFIN